MLKNYFVLIIFILMSGGSVSAQLSIGDIKKDADNFVKHKQYFKAIKLYERIKKIKPSEKIDLFKVGLSYYHTNQLDEARKNFVILLNQDSKPGSLVYLYLANIYHQELDYSQAIHFYKLFLKKAGTGHRMSSYAIDQVKRCAVGRDLYYAEQLAYAENMGSTLNSIYDEIIPMPSPNYSDKIYFSSVREGNTGGPKNEKGERDPLHGHYLSDMFTADLNQGIWSHPRPINDHINSDNHDYLLGFGRQGKLIYFNRTNFDHSELLVDTFVQQLDTLNTTHTGRWLINFGIDKTGSIHFYNDTTLLFSSRVLSGYGGYDIFISKFRNDQWSVPQNLGPDVNTPYDEVSPFLTLDGRSLFFSSNRLTSIGGFDIFKISYNDRTNSWQKLENVKIPINSAADDLYFRLDHDGSRGWFASGRTEGYGGLDLYSCFFKKKIPEHLTHSSPLTFDLVKKNGSLASNDGISSMVDQSTPIFSSDEIRDFTVSPIYYEENDFILSPANIKMIDKYISLLKSYPSLKIQLTAHSDDRDPIEFDKYFSIKRVEKLANHMIENGVGSSKILIRGCGSQYPVAQNVKDGIAYRAGQTLNRRIEVQIVDAESMPIKIKYEEPAISERIALPQGDLYQEMINGLTYRVKIASTSQPFTQSSFIRAENSMVEKSMNEHNYDFLTGVYTSYTDAKNKKAEAMGSGLSGVQIYVYLDGVRLNRAELHYLTPQYPELTYYLQEN